MQDNSDSVSSKARLSIITICYNAPDLDKTCRSIVNQTCQDFEWVVIDGGSNEETQKIWDKYKFRIDKFVSEKDNGIYDACNKGIRLSSGEFIIFINGGDNLHDKNVIKNLYEHKFDKDVIYGNLFINGKLFNQDLGKITPEFFITFCLPTPATIMRKSMVEMCGCFNAENKIVSDLELFIKLAKNNAMFKYVPVDISDFYTNGISSSAQGDEMHRNERLETLKKYFTEDEIKKASADYKLKNSFVQKIFSIKNSPNRLYKIITILGLRIKFPIKK